METVTSFKYLGSVRADEGSQLEIISRIAQMTAALTMLKPVWMTEAFLSVPRYEWNATLSHPSPCMLVNQKSSQQRFKEECKSWKWGATARYYAFQTKTMLPTRKTVPSSSRQLDHTKTSWASHIDANCSGMVMPPVLQVWQKPSCKAQWKGEVDKADRRKCGKTTSENGHAWSSPSPMGQWRTEKYGGNWLWSHLWCPNELCGKGIGEVRYRSVDICARRFQRKL